MWEDKCGLQVSNIWGCQLDTSQALIFCVYTQVQTLSKRIAYVCSKTFIGICQKTNMTAKPGMLKGSQMWREKYALQMSNILGCQLITSKVLVFVYTHVWTISKDIGINKG